MNDLKCKKVCIIGHGRKHQQILSIDHEKCIMIDKDYRVYPDIVLNMTVDFVSDYQITNTFDIVLMANSCYMLSINTFCETKYVEQLNYHVLNNICSLLRPDGILH